MGDHRLPRRVISGELDNAGQRGPGGKEKEWIDCVAEKTIGCLASREYRCIIFHPGGP